MNDVVGSTENLGDSDTENGLRSVNICLPKLLTKKLLTAGLLRSDSKNKIVPSPSCYFETVPTSNSYIRPLVVS